MNDRDREVLELTKRQAWQLGLPLGLVVFVGSAAAVVICAATAGVLEVLVAMAGMVFAGFLLVLLMLLRLSLRAK